MVICICMSYNLKCISLSQIHSAYEFRYLVPIFLLFIFASNFKKAATYFLLYYRKHDFFKEIRVLTEEMHLLDLFI